MCAKGKVILAADESTGTIAKRFKSINVENTEKNRLVFRQTLFNSEAMKNYIGGVILFDETIKQKTTLGPTIPELILKNNAIPGIKVDKGAKPLAVDKCVKAKLFLLLLIAAIVSPPPSIDIRDFLAVLSEIFFAIAKVPSEKFIFFKISSWSIP